MCLTTLHRFSTSWIISSLNSDRAGSLRVLSSRSSHEPGVSDCHRLKCPFRFSVSNGNKCSIAGICSRRAVSLFGLSGVRDWTEFGSGISAFKEMLDLSAGELLPVGGYKDLPLRLYNSRAFLFQVQYWTLRHGDEGVPSCKDVAVAVTTGGVPAELCVTLFCWRPLANISL